MNIQEYILEKGISKDNWHDHWLAVPESLIRDFCEVRKEWVNLEDPLVILGCINDLWEWQEQHPGSNAIADKLTRWSSPDHALMFRLNIEQFLTTKGNQPGATPEGLFRVAYPRLEKFWLGFARNMIVCKGFEIDEEILEKMKNGTFDKEDAKKMQEKANSVGTEYIKMVHAGLLFTLVADHSRMVMYGHNSLLRPLIEEMAAEWIKFIHNGNSKAVESQIFAAKEINEHNLFKPYNVLLYAQQFGIYLEPNIYIPN